MTIGRMAFVGVLDRRDRWNVLSRVRGGLVRQFTELMSPSHCCPGPHSPTALADRSHAPGARLATRRAAIRDRRRGGIERVFRGGTVSMGRMASVGVLDCRDRWNVSRERGGLSRRFKRLKCARARILKMRLIVQMPGGCALEARGNAIRDRCPDGIDGRRVSRYSAVKLRIGPHRLRSHR